MNKHTTDKGVSNSLRGFFERIVKPYTTKSIDDAKAEQSVRYPMTFEKFAGNIAVYKASIPTNAYINGDRSTDIWYGHRGFTVNKNDTEIFTSKLSKNNYDNSFINTANSKYVSLGLAEENLSSGSAKLINLAPLTEKAFPFEPKNFAVYWANPSYNSDTPNVFFVPEYGNDSNTYDGTIQTIGFIKANDGYDIGNLNGFGYYSKIETRKEKCCFYKIDASVPEARELKVNINVLEIPEVKQKLIEVFETTEEELDSKIQTIRIMDAINVNNKATCILISVNNTKLMAIYYKYSTNNVAVVAKIEVFNIGSDINFSKLTRKIYEKKIFRDEGDRYSTEWVREYIESAITTVDGRVFRFICDPDYVILNRVEGDTSGNDWHNYHYPVTREPELLLEEAEVGDFIKDNTIIGIIDNSTSYISNSSNSSMLMPMSNYNTTRIATLNGMIVFEDAVKNVSGEFGKGNKVETTVNNITETRKPLVTRIIKDNVFEDFKLQTTENLAYYLKRSKNIILEFGEIGYLAFMGELSDNTLILYSPDGVSWFLATGNKDYGFSSTFRARYIYNYYSQRLNYGQVIESSGEYFEAGLYSNTFYISPNNSNFKPVLFKEHITSNNQKNYDVTYSKIAGIYERILTGTEVMYLSYNNSNTNSTVLPTIKII